MFRRRGCLFGCGSFILLGLLATLLIWFVAIPRISDAFEDGVSDSLATVIADEIDPLYSQSQLQSGEDVRFSFTTLNQQMRDSNQDDQVDKVEILSSGDQIVMLAVMNNREWEIALIPEVTQDGRLQLNPAADGSWIEDRVMDILGGGLEAAINEWLQRNGLVLTGLTLEPNGIVLSVTGE